MSTEDVDCSKGDGFLEGIWESIFGDNDKNIGDLVGKCETESEKGLTVVRGGSVSCYGGSFESDDSS